MWYYANCPECGSETRLSNDYAEDFDEGVECECGCEYIASVMVEIDYNVETTIVKKPTEAERIEHEVKNLQYRLKILLPKMKDDTATEKERCQWRSILKRLRVIDEEEESC